MLIIGAGNPTTIHHMASTTDNQTKHFLIFDYLRVAAMSGVLAVHFSQQFPMPSLLRSIAGMGMFCVQIFFVISGYLGCSYFFKPKASTPGYYKKRALRILPTYYAAIVATMLYVEFATEGYNPDIFHLGWLRYFLGLNTILPSADFWQWNNAFGFWTMTDFIFFYAIMPLIIKVVSTFKRSIIFFLCCFATAGAARISANYLTTLPAFSNFEIELLIYWSPLVQLQHFSLGIMTFFAVKETKKSFAAIILICTAMLPNPMCTSALIFSVLTCLFILTVREQDVIIKGRPLRFLHFVSKYSFHIYLTHLLALQIGQKVTEVYVKDPSPFFYLSKFTLFIFITVALCCFLELCQKVANIVFKTT